MVSELVSLHPEEVASVSEPAFHTLTLVFSSQCGPVQCGAA